MTLLLTILKTVGKALLWIIAVLFILLLVIIFCPIFYEITGEKYDKAKAEAKIKALFGILKIDLGYDKNGMSVAVKIFGKKLKAFDDGEGTEPEKEQKKAENSKGPEKKASEKKAEGNEKTKASQPVIPKKESTVKKPRPEIRSIPKETDKKDDGNDNIKRNIPERKSAEAIPRQSSAAYRKAEDEKEKTIVTAEWENAEAEEKEISVRKIKLSEAEVPKEPKKFDNVRIKYVKMPEENDDGVNGPEKDKKNKQNKDSAGSGDKKDSREKHNGKDIKDIDENEEKEPERLDLQYFKNMPSSERKKLFKAVIRLLKSVFRSVKPRDFYLKGRLGLSDPALTGQIVGAAWAIGGALNKRIEIKAAFDEEIIEGDFKVKGHIVPAFMMFYIIRFIAVKPVRKIIILLIKGDRNGK